MKVQIVSDLHLDFYRNLRQKTVTLDALYHGRTEVLIVAGDVSQAACLVSNLKLIYELFPQVVYVAGNHEYYGHSPKAIEMILKEAGRQMPNFHWLNNSGIGLGGINFYGTTLWFEYQPDNPRYASRLNDFRLIRGFVPWVYGENDKAKHYLRGLNPENVDVVVTHHLPHPSSIAPHYRTAPLNRFYLCDMTPTIHRLAPKLWVHGHTHTSMDYIVDGTNTRVVCNPFGYANVESNPEFNKSLIIEV